MQGSIRQRSEGSWEIIWELSRGADGKRRPRSKTIRGTKKAAQAELRRILTAIENGGYTEPTKITMAEYLDQWLRSAKSRVTGSTFDRYEKIVRCHLVPELGEILLSKLSALHLDSAYRKWEEGGRKDNREGGLSAQSVVHHHRVIRAALGQAVRKHLIPRNVAEDADPPRVPRKEIQSLTEEETVALLAAVKDTPLYLPVLLAVATGCRRGEICGLKWANIDLDRGRLIVSRSLEVAAGAVKLKEPKSGRSRPVPLPAFAVEALRRHKGEQAAHRLLLGPAYEHQDFVVAWPDGKPYHPDYITKAFAKLARSRNLPTTRFHALRHTHASALLRADVHPKVVSERLGHSTIAITMDTYSHLIGGMGEEAARRLDEALRRAGGS